MRYTTQSHGGTKASKEWKADRKSIIEPKVKTVKRNGTVYYQDKQGKLYIPELFDKFFRVVKGKIKGYGFKGKVERVLTEQV